MSNAKSDTTKRAEAMAQAISNRAARRHDKKIAEHRALQAAARRSERQAQADAIAMSECLTVN